MSCARAEHVSLLQHYTVTSFGTFTSFMLRLRVQLLWNMKGTSPLKHCIDRLQCTEATAILEIRTQCQYW